MSDEITMYTSDTCTHSWAVERFMEKHEIPVKLINISRNAEARQKVIELNRGYASVPTLIFSDGTQMTEPSFGELKAKLNIQTPSLWSRIRSLFSGGE